MISCNDSNQNSKEKAEIISKTDSVSFSKGLSDVNGIRMYYEVHGEGDPVVLIHGGGSTIETSFDKLIPALAGKRKVIAVELQAHGRTSDRDKELSFEQDADDVAVLLSNLKISKADFIGFSNGGTTALQIAIRHPEIVNRLIIGSPLAKCSGMPEQFWGFMKNAQLENMPGPLKESFKKVTGDTIGLRNMHDKDARRMVNFKDIPDAALKSIKAKTLIIIADKDVILPEHGLVLHRTIDNSQLAILPGVHGEYFGEVTTLKPNFKPTVVMALIDNFLQE